MTYEAHEISMQNGEPIELYRFNFGENIYRFTSAKSSIVIDGETWHAAVLQRNDISFSADKGRNNLNIKTARDFVISDLFRITPPSDAILVSVLRRHLNDSEIVVMWSGRIITGEFSGSTATLYCEPINTSLKRVGLRRLYQRQCPHVLYGSDCHANKSAFTVPATLSAVSGVMLTSATFGLYANGYFSGGYIDFNTGGVIERRFVIDHQGSVIKVNLPLYSLVVGSSIIVYAGCDHTVNTCKNKFNNLDNYGGFPHIPQKNPFGSNGIY